MKKVIVASLMILLSIALTAQPYSSLNKEQLQNALVKAKSKTNVGIALTGIGLAATATGYYLYSNVNTSIGDMTAGFFIMLSGFGLTAAGIPTWITGKIKKNKIELELVKYNNTGLVYPGSRPVYGAGINITF